MFRLTLREDGRITQAHSYNALFDAVAELCTEIGSAVEYRATAARCGFECGVALERTGYCHFDRGDGYEVWLERV